MKNWNLFKHTILSLGATLLAYFLLGLSRFHEAASIGIIGGADGPTSVFVSGQEIVGFPSIILNLIWWEAYPEILVFLAMMLLYRPVKKVLEGVKSH